ncbi:MAG: alkaline phosphatase [Actinobacteria bacterium HGW-Actinobacteria-5]|jgi:DeoR family transcriptional regulator of aga operon|nr:MAG: alkaline phosphatase [Actinobacteria bacterium HGW-Actinobacteria-5]
MTQQDRLNRVLELVAERGSLSIGDVSEALGVSPATVRRDLNQLADQQLVVRTHGGASVLSSGFELPLRYKVPKESGAKLAIAAAVERMVQPGMAIALNGGTTTSEVARALGRSQRLLSPGGEPTVTLITNALNIAYELTLRQQFRLIVTGGVVRQKSYELVSTLVQQTLGEFTVDLAVLGVDGISVGSGATTLTPEEALVGRWFAEAARRVVIAADSTKLNRATFARLFGIDRVDVLITDSRANPQRVAELVSAGVDVRLADAVH